MFYFISDFISYNHFTRYFLPSILGIEELATFREIVLFWYVVLTIFSWIIFVIQLIKNNDEFKKLKLEIFSLSYPQFFFTIIFSLLLAIPLKIFVNNKFSVRFRYLCAFIISLILYGEFLLTGFLLPIYFFILINRLIVFLFENEPIFKDNPFYEKYIKFFFYGCPEQIYYTSSFNMILYLASLRLNIMLTSERDLINSKFVIPAVKNLEEYLIAEGTLSVAEMKTRTILLINKIICEEGFLILPFNQAMPLEDRMLLFFKKCINFLPSDFFGQYLYIYFVISCIMIGISIYLFIGIIEKNKPFFDLLKIKFDELNFVNRLLLVIFSFIYGIPNLVYVNQPSPKIRFNLIFLISIILGFYVPIFNFVLCFLLIVIFQSLLVAFLYEKNDKSKYIIDLLLFGGDSDFAKFYFDFFWGK